MRLVVLLFVAAVIVVTVRGVGAWVQRRRRERRRALAGELERWAIGEATSEWDWRPLLEGPWPHPDIEPFRQRLLRLREQHAPEHPEQWCSPGGWPELRQIAADLRAV